MRNTVLEGMEELGATLGCIQKDKQAESGDSLGRIAVALERIANVAEEWAKGG